MGGVSVYACLITESLGSRFYDEDKNGEYLKIKKVIGNGSK